MCHSDKLTKRTAENLLFGMESGLARKNCREKLPGKSGLLFMRLFPCLSVGWGLYALPLCDVQVRTGVFFDRLRVC